MNLHSNPINKMKIAVIDSGINLKYKDFDGKEIEYADLGDFHDENGHGTACCGECLLIDADSEMLILKVLDTHAKGTLLKMAEALEYCYTRNDVGVISISAACCVDDEETIAYFQRLVDKLHQKRILIVAACLNGTKKGFPACLKHVIAVSYKKSRGSIECFCFFKGKGIYWGKNRLMPWKRETYKFFSGNSSAVPRAAALLNRNISSSNVRIGKINRQCGLYFVRERKYKVIALGTLIRILLEYYGILQTSGRWKTETDCINTIKYIERKGGMLLDYKIFSTSDFKSYGNFCRKCIFSLARRM